MAQVTAGCRSSPPASPSKPCSPSRRVSDVVLIANGATWTVSVALPFTPLSAAEMVVTPTETALAKPLALIVATSVLDDVHVTWLVMFWVLLSE